MTHEIIKVEKYLLVVDDAKNHPIDANCRWIFVDGAIQRTTSIQPCDGVNLILGHLPLNNSPILQGVDLLPPLEQEDDVEKLADETYPKTYYSGIYVDGWLKAGFIKGYNKAKEKYRFTEEDMIKAFIEGTNYGSAYQSCIENEDWKAVKEMDEYDDDTIKEIIQCLSQPKMPTHFEIEIEPMNLDEIRQQGKGFLNANTNKPKTTTNNLGQTQWVGKYIYA